MRTKSLAVAIGSFFLIVVVSLLALQYSVVGLQNKQEELLSQLDDQYSPFTKEDLHFLSQGLFLSREYQTKVFRSQWKKRNDFLPAFQATLADVLGIPELTQPGNATTRFQYFINSTDCGKNFNLRLRDYYTGYRANTTTCDIKSSTDGIKGPGALIGKEWVPASTYMESAQMKFEWDIHPCKVKYSIESRVDVPFKLDMTKCSHMGKVFPIIASEIKSNKRDEKLSLAENYYGWWWEYEHRGFLSDNVTEYKTALTLEYEDHATALMGITPPMMSPEWSIRIYSTNKGHGPWVRKTVEDMDRRYKQLLEVLGSPDYPCEKTFPQGQKDVNKKK